MPASQYPPIPPALSWTEFNDAIDAAVDDYRQRAVSLRHLKALTTPHGPSAAQQLELETLAEAGLTRLHGLVERVAETPATRWREVRAKTLVLSLLCSEEADMADRLTRSLCRDLLSETFDQYKHEGSP
jgi:hypothetical protein